jgi:hypothetical protein
MVMISVVIKISAWGLFFSSSKRVGQLAVTAAFEQYFPPLDSWFLKRSNTGWTSGFAAA